MILMIKDMMHWSADRAGAYPAAAYRPLQIWADSEGENTQVKKLAKYLKPYRFLAIVSPLIMIGEVFGDLLLPFLMPFMVNYGVLGTDVYDPCYSRRFKRKKANYRF